MKKIVFIDAKLAALFEKRLYVPRNIDPQRIVGIKLVSNGKRKKRYLLELL